MTEDADAITEVHNAVLGKKVFAVDAPDGEHDLEEAVSMQHAAFPAPSFPSIAIAIHQLTPSHLSIRRGIVQEEHLAGVNRIIDQASVLEDPAEVKRAQELREEIRLKSYNPDTDFYNAKY